MPLKCKRFQFLLCFVSFLCFYGSVAPVSTWLQCNRTVTVLLVEHNYFCLFLAYIIEHLKRRDWMFFCHKFHSHFHGVDKSLGSILFHFYITISHHWRKYCFGSVSYLLLKYTEGLLLILLFILILSSPSVLNTAAPFT